MDEQAYSSHEDLYAADTTDAEHNKLMGILAYCGFLVVIPLAMARSSRFAMFHANQGLLLLLAWIACWLLWQIPLIGWLALFGNLFLLLLMVVGIITAARGTMKPLPVIGGITLVK